MPSSPRSAARSATSSRRLLVLARVGFVANGVVHILLGTIVLAVAFGGGGQPDQAGAFEALASAPFGAVALWACAIGLWALGLWRALQALASRGSDTGDRLKSAASNGGQAIAYFAVGGVAASVALGARPQSEQNAQNASGSVLALPGGQVLLGIVAAVIGAIGIAFVVMGLRRSFRKKVTTPRGSAGTAFVALGAIGYVAKGIALATVGVLIMTAAVTVDPSAAGGLDGAVSALLAAPAGRWIGAAVGIGFIAYGIFTVIRARYARIDG
ncbi:DUF1206 domain-containing protein [Microbacterium sp. P05]|uniref:DUF1206 domain-containing protein n=1 Tax=Microbacterium sp. P05 TaxID=3366948 RepID=UPI0037464157